MFRMYKKRRPLSTVFKVSYSIKAPISLSTFLHKLYSKQHWQYTKTSTICGVIFMLFIVLFVVLFYMEILVLYSKTELVI
jgi:hypothetical protein